MSNYTNQNLINVPSSKVPAGTLAMKVGQNIFTAGHVIIQISSSGTQDLAAYVVQSNSGVLYARKLKFNGAEASDSQTVELLSDSSVMIFNTGHQEPQGGSTPGSSTDFYKCTYVSSDSSMTWSGRKAVLNAGAYSFQSDSTEGLIYSAFRPQIDLIYDSSCLIKAQLFQGIPLQGLVFYHPLSRSLQILPTGQQITTVGSPSFIQDSGINCCQFNGGSYIKLSDLSTLPTGSTARTMSFWMKVAQFAGQDDYGYVGYGSAQAATWFVVISRSTGLVLSLYQTDILVSSEYTPLNTWLNVVITCTSSNVKVYINGTLRAQSAISSLNTNPYGLLTLGATAYSSSDIQKLLVGKLSAVRIYNRTLTQTQITSLSQQFTPTA